MNSGKDLYCLHVRCRPDARKRDPAGTPLELSENSLRIPLVLCLARDKEQKKEVPKERSRIEPSIRLDPF